MQRIRRMAGVGCAAAVAFGLVARAQQAPPRATPQVPALPAPASSPVAPQTPRPARPDEKLPAGAPQFHAMYLDHTLFQPDKMWTYEGADDDRPDAHNVEQNSFVRLGNRIVGSHGALVSYVVDSYADAKTAHAAFVRRVPKPLARPVALRVNRRLRAGDEGVESILTSTQEREAVRILRQSFFRFGRYVIEIGGEADMRAPVDRPAQGERPWMCEPVYAQVRAAALDKWSHYKTVLTVAP